MKLFFDLSVVFIALCVISSLCVGVAHRLGKRWLEAQAPGRRARIRLALLFSPPVMASLAVGLALLPSLLHLAGVAVDHCLAPDAHGHAHLCFVHAAQGVSLALATTVALVGAVLLSRLGFAAARALRASRAFHALISSSHTRAFRAGAVEFDSEVPVCVTLGVLHPRIFISTGAIRALGSGCVDAALSHERAHLARHETRFRLGSRLAAAFHLPFLSEPLLRAWQQDSEFICDRSAARAAGSTTLVAEALVRFSRAQRQLRASPLTGGACLCAEGSGLNSRVTTLLSLDVARLEEPALGGRLACALGGGLLFVGLMLQARPVHHALESLVAVLAAAPH